MNRILLTIASLIGLLFGMLATGCQSSSTSDSEATTRPAAGEFGAATYDDEDIPLADVPDHVMQAALDAVPGLVPSEAELETHNGDTIYEIEGTVDGTEYEVEVTADGEVVDIEIEDDERD